MRAIAACSSKRLADQPMMRAVLADMALEVEAAIALDRCGSAARSISPRATRGEAARARLLTPAVKFWVCKTAPALIYEAMECLGGNGYVEESLLPRLYREAPVNAIWEGSGNVMCLDVLRAFARDGEAARAVLDALAREAGDLPGAPEAKTFIQRTLAAGDAEFRARAVVERLAILAALAALQASAPRTAEMFARARRTRGGMFGSADLSAREAATELDRALPA